MRPYAVLSNGEKFRVELARRLLEDGDPIVIDEFTSVVDRQVAQIGSHAVQKYCRRQSKRFVAVGCHYDVIDWLQPDWVLDMATRQFSRRLLQRRPALDCVVGRVPRSAWEMFAPYHYLTGELHRAAQCYALWCGGRIAAFAGMIPVPVSAGPDKGTAIWRCSRLVTLPDWQGLGLAMVLIDAVGSEYAGARKRVRTYPAHPALVRSFDNSKHWRMTKPPGQFSTRNDRSDNPALTSGGRPCATFEYCGPAAAEPRIIS
jgi:GNAT superfamily N-acetyltransferase